MMRVSPLLTIVIEKKCDVEIEQKLAMPTFSNPHEAPSQQRERVTVKRRRARARVGAKSGLMMMK